MSQLHHSLSRNARLILAISTLSVAGFGLASGQSITVPNFSFETPNAPFSYPYITFNLDSWQRPAQPAYFSVVEQNFGITWTNTTAVFVAPGAYGNMQGIQAAYLMSFPQVALFQDNIGSTFEVGKSYTLTIGTYGKGFVENMTDGSTLGLSLFYVDGANQITIGTPSIANYAAANFPTVGALNLHELTVGIPAVQATDAWAGKNIGIRIESINGVGDGYWDVDNVRLVAAVPEPSAAALVILGSSLWLSRRKSHRA